MIRKRREENKHTAQAGFVEGKGMDRLGHVEETGYAAELRKKQGQLQKPVHISRDLFCDWQEGKLKTPEETDFFTHIGACTFCAEQFANWMEEGLLDEAEFAPEAAPASGTGGSLENGTLLKDPPRYLKEEILSRTRQLDVQASVKLKETSRQVQLMAYSLKVGFAVVASIFLLTVTADIQNLGLGQTQGQQAGQVQELPESQQAGQRQPEGREEEGNIVGRLRQGSKEITGLLNEFSNGLFRIEMDSSETKRNQEVTR